MRGSYPPSATEALAGGGGGGSAEIEIAESGTMLDSRGKFNDLKTMLDSNKENVKMDAMRRIIQMVARGKDVSELFPAVVKNVAAKNLELKKLVYVYLVRYAEEQQDLALLSISTFQRGLKDPNQLIRASALRVLSSIRVQMLSPVLLLAIKESVRDMSAYVRKVAAHAIPKLFSLDPELQAPLIECIDFLLGDKRTLVLGSAVYAFEQTCPDRLDLLHRHFRLLCRALVDVDEWGQIVMIGLLTRYARTQFLSPFAGRKQSSADEQEDEPNFGHRQPLDPDHNLLITSVRPLLQSRNPAVVMAVAQLLYYIAGPAQLSVVPRALVRLLRGPNEVQYIVLVNIASICFSTAHKQQQQQEEKGQEEDSQQVFAISKNLFEPFLKSFFIRSSDTVHVKQLKLQVLTSLVTEANVQLVVRELQAYIQTWDMAELAIDAIGRCALQVPTSAECCLATLIKLISSPNAQEHIVCASVVVLKRLLHSDAPLPLLKRVFRLIDTVKAPMARACILWLIGTHLQKMPKLGPDLLRKVAKTFCEEAECVKLQALNLAVRLWITEPRNREGKCALLIKYIFQLARFDRSYDLRDRCRFLRNFLFGQGGDNIESQQLQQQNIVGVEEQQEQKGGEEAEPTIIANGNGIVKFPLEIFLSERPAPTVQNAFADRAEHFQLGTLSHLLNQKCAGYTELPDFPAEQPDPTIRRSAYPLPSESPEKTAAGKKAKILTRKFVEEESDEEESEEEFTSNEEEEEEEEVDEEEEESDDEDEGGEEDEEEETDEDEEEKEEEEQKGEKEEETPKKAVPSPAEEEEAGAIAKAKLSTKQQKKPTTTTATETKKAAADSNDFLLLDLDFGPPTITTSSFGATGMTGDGAMGGIGHHHHHQLSKWARAPAQWAPDGFPLNLVVPVVSGGLTIDGRFCRSPCLFSSSMVCLELQISFRSSQHSQLRASDVQLTPSSETSSSSLPTSGPVTMHGLGEGERRRLTLGIDFGDSAQASEWHIRWANGERNTKFQVQAPYGEQLEAIELSQEAFLEQRAKLGGMNQQRWPLAKAPDALTARQLYKQANCKQVQGLKLCFAAQTVSRKELVLISILQVVENIKKSSISSASSSSVADDEKEKDGGDKGCWQLQINVQDNIAFGSILGQQLAEQLGKTE